MGEYAYTADQGTVKVGTCNTMYYLRYEDRHLTRPVTVFDFDPAAHFDLFWRLPFPDEDDLGTAKHSTIDTPCEYDRGVPLYRRTEDHGVEYYTDSDLINQPGRIQLTHPSGLLVLTACYHGLRLPTEGGEFSASWNGYRHSLELKHIKNDQDGKLLPVVGCKHCLQLWTLRDEPSDPPGAAWKKILDYVEHDAELHRRLSEYARQ